MPTTTAPGRHAPPATPAPPRNRRVCVIHLLHTMAYGGIETVLINWTRAFDPRAFEVHLVCFANPGDTHLPFVRAAEAAGFHVRTIPWGRRKPLFKASRALARIIDELDARILHTHGWYADFVGLLTGRLRAVKTVTTSYVWSKFDWKRNLIQAIDRHAIRWFDQVTAHCEDTYRRTIALGFSPKKVKTLISGFDSMPVDLSVEERSRRRRELGIEDGHVLLINVARLYPEKAHDALLRSFAKVRARHPLVRLWIAGVGPLEARVRSLCTELQLDDAVRFLGFVTDLPTWLALADIMVHPAHAEGVPQAVCAGMAAGLPIIASNVGGMPEILRDGQTGRLIAPGDEENFAVELGRLVEDQQERRNLGDAARQWLAEHYSLSAAVRRVEEMYVEVLGK